MPAIRPFPAIRARDDLAGEIIAPPYDVVSEDEARAIVAQQPTSFLRITRPEVDLPPGGDPHRAEAYAKGRENFDAFLRQGLLIQDENPCFYLYSQTWRGRTQSGLMALCRVEDYDAGIIKRHELTRPDKEQDRVDHIAALDAQTGLVFLTFRDSSSAARAALAQARSLAPAWEVATDDGVRHALTVLDDPGLIAALQEAFAALPSLYVADGHHRSAAASRVAAARAGSGTSGWFLTGIFPDSELEILAYNRLVADLNGRSPAAFLAEVGQHFDVQPGASPAPARRGELRMYLEGQWYGLAARPGVTPDDPVGSLDVSVLQTCVLSPLLGIQDPRTDKRIAFVGGIRGTEALEQAVDKGEAAVAFSLYPTGIDQLLAVADADKLMPPKSTWFEPKLRGGVLIHRIV